MMEMRGVLIPAMESLMAALEIKAAEFSDVRKIARTHLQDAVPMALGEEFSGYARQLALSIRRVQGTEESLAELALGGTAVGTGLNTHPKFAAGVIAGLSRETGCPFREAVNHFEAQAAQDGAVEASGAFKGYAVSLVKIANDIRWLSSGPRCGLGEIDIPSLQPGSSIMPGKVNPVILEAVVQVGAQVIGNDTAITMSGQAGNFELNVMLPVIAHNLLQSIALLGAVTAALEEKCVKGITANSRRCAANLEQSLAVCTALVPAIGYDNAAAVSKAAYAQERTVREVALEMKVLPEEELNKILDTMVYGKD
jgi:fumarate hydratase class II